MNKVQTPEPWLQGTLRDVPPVQRAVLHALELAEVDLRHWCGRLTDSELNARPAGLPPIAFHLRHIARSIDRLLTYAEGRRLDPEQISALKSELDPPGNGKELFAELDAALQTAAARIRSFTQSQFDEPRLVGSKGLATTVAGLLVHVADHTQRHTGQAVTTSKVLLAERAAGPAEPASRPASA